MHKYQQSALADHAALIVAALLISVGYAACLGRLIFCPGRAGASAGPHRCAGADTAAPPAPAN